VLHDALARMNARNEGPVGVTPALVQRAFLQIRADGGSDIWVTSWRAGDLHLG
jgi:hypothetical protein